MSALGTCRIRAQADRCPTLPRARMWIGTLGGSASSESNAAIGYVPESYLHMSTFAVWCSYQPEPSGRRLGSPTPNVFPARSWSRPSINCRSKFWPAHWPTLSVEESCSSRATMRMRVRPSLLSRRALTLQRSKPHRSAAMQPDRRCTPAARAHGCAHCLQPG
jgi:hypothetical protein